ncbi:MAG TPA: LolA-related protein [Paucimonas sp.]|nr:LolA-related protein [Paucimonas sp.]HJW54888.1 LolA-related protein [Burkholderiaceae bacterium]
MNVTSIRPVFRRTFLFLLAIAFWPALSMAADWDIDQLMQSMGKVASGRATFIEKKTMAMLERPVESSGELLYTAPDHLEKRTLKPKPETMTIDGGTLTIERGRQKLAVQLSEYPELAGFLDSIRGTLAGDRKALERVFRLQLEGGAERWQLSLTPTDGKMATTIHLIRIAGSRDNVRRIEIIQTDGDRSVMTVTPVATP